jgi:hypothetical protein
MLGAMTPLRILLHKAHQIRTLPLVPRSFQFFVHQPDITISDRAFKKSTSNLLYDLTVPSGAGPPYDRGLMITLTYTTIGKTPLVA